MKIKINLTPKIRGKVTLGPVPGTPEYAEEQRQKAAAQQADPEPPQAA